MGPITYIRDKDTVTDRNIILINKRKCRWGVISIEAGWRRDKNYSLGIGKLPYETVIINAPDPNIF
jgi:hypothetical protein